MNDISTPKVVGVGFSKTGTSTLAECLRTLGYRHCSFNRELTRAVANGETMSALEKLRGFDSAADWPWPFLYREIDQTYPDTLFVLTVRRDAMTWVQSLKRQAEKRPGSPYREVVYGRRHPHGHEEEMIARYEAHNSAVRAYFSSEPGRLLEVCWETGSGWGELCEFLDKPNPNLPLPHANPSPPVLRRLFRKLRFAFRRHF
ncbi:sulfotransferase family protein [Wenzhouxiangella sp. EGI_FJ10409]|uniref:sulfotransferase family protein n=1 Tax=Wenzhouxiangella sp. EGI_FJ10409 TaxID=3243767 RepID=UPI0035D55B80